MFLKYQKCFLTANRTNINQDLNTGHLFQALTNVYLKIAQGVQQGRSTRIESGRILLILTVDEAGVKLQYLN